MRHAKHVLPPCRWLLLPLAVPLLDCASAQGARESCFAQTARGPGTLGTMLSTALAIANAVQFSVCGGVLRVLGLARASPKRAFAVLSTLVRLWGSSISLLGSFTLFGPLHYVCKYKLTRTFPLMFHFAKAFWLSESCPTWRGRRFSAVRSTCDPLHRLPNSQ